MSINKRNAEGYSDPTAYEALLRAWAEDKRRAFRPLVFICSSLSSWMMTRPQTAPLVSSLAGCS